LELVWKTVTAAYLDVLYRHLPGGVEDLERRCRLLCAQIRNGSLLNGEPA